MENIKINDAELSKVAIESKQLASSYSDIARDCFGLDGASFTTELQNRFPVVTWLLGTSLSQTMRARVTNGLLGTRIGEDGEYLLEIPRSLWSETPENSADECCWTPVQFDKCAGEVPMNLLCLKDCDNIMDILMNKTIRLAGRDAVAPIAYAGETIEAVNDRVARMSMALYTAHTVMQGMLNVTTNMTKPFNGLAQVMSNPAVVHIDGSSILGAFEELACRMLVLGFTGSVFAGHPLVIEAIRQAIEPDQYNRRPAGWTVTDGTIRFKGVRFIEDKLVPFSTTTNTGEIWMLNGDAVGAMLLTDLIPSEAFRRSGWSFDENNCGTECRYYYNAGAAFANNANKLAVISNISITDACANGTADLAGLVVPNTLIPKA